MTLVKAVIGGIPSKPSTVVPATATGAITHFAPPGTDPHITQFHE
jgi:hypothetical protein